MGSSNNNFTPAVPAQIRYILQWFQEWSEMQRNDFIPVLAQKFGNKDYVNGLLASLDNLSNLEGAPPSLFQCRIKLFKDWVDNWSQSDKEHLLNELKLLDNEFFKKYEEALNPELAPQEDDFAFMNGNAINGQVAEEVN